MDIEQYKKAEAQLHVAAQMISLTGKNLVDKQTDDSHTTAKWDSEKQFIIGRVFELDENKYSVFLDPIGFALGLLKNGIESERIELDGLTYMQTVEPWKRWLNQAGLVGELDLSLHYSLPDSDLYKFEAFNKPNQDILASWVANRTLANRAFSNLTRLIGIESDINIWPHHIDTGTYYVLHETEGAGDRSIGAGFNPADSMVSEPYFYIYNWYKDHEIDYSDSPILENGRWILDSWKGAVLPLSELGKEPKITVNRFFVNASNYLKSKLK